MLNSSLKDIGTIKFLERSLILSTLFNNLNRASKVVRVVVPIFPLIIILFIHLKAHLMYNTTLFTYKL